MYQVLCHLLSVIPSPNDNLIHLFIIDPWGGGQAKVNIVTSNHVKQEVVLHGGKGEGRVVIGDRGVQPESVPCG